MGHALYATRLYWAGTRGGIAKLHGRCVEIHAPPHIGGAPVVGIDYIPEIAMHQVQPVGERWRDMTADEVREADSVLQSICRPAG